MSLDRFHLYAGHGKRPKAKELEPGDFHGDYFSPAVAKLRASKIEAEYDWWAILDTETGKYFAKMQMPLLTEE